MNKQYLQYTFVRHSRILSKSASNSFIGFILTEQFYDKIVSIMKGKEDLKDVIRCILESDAKYSHK